MLADTTKTAIRAIWNRLREGLPGYRPRPAQGRMIAAVATTLAEGRTAAIEAPTGTGKSMAYLVAAVEVARAQEKKLLLATATVALQEQLIERDIPQYRQLSGHEDLRVALAKGRRRYLCPRNLAHAAQGMGEQQLELGGELAMWATPPSDRDRHALAELESAFAQRQWDGDMDHAPAPMSDTLQALLTTSAGGCTGRKCAWFMQCPFFAARRAVDDADLIVANQDLMLSDLMMPGDEEESWGGVILPKPEKTLYVIDEGHHLPAKALARGAGFVAMELSRRQLGRLVRQVQAAYALTEKERLGGLGFEAAEETLQQQVDAMDTLETAIRRTWTPDPAEREPVYRASLGQLPQDWQQHALDLAVRGGTLQRWLTAVRRAVMEMTENGPTREALARELGIALERNARELATWQAWCMDDDPGGPPMARWTSLTGDGRLGCHASGVSAAELLRRILWDNAAGVVLTSATLSAGGNFRDFADAAGLPDSAVTLALPSPFDLARQASLDVPWMQALPGEREAHAQAISDWLDAELDWDSGNLVLFTSRAKLERVLQLLSIARVRLIRAQGTQAKADLLAAHRADIEAGKGSTLFGLASFGEGLDLPGKLCETVVLTQIPFAVPTDPVGATWAEWLEAQGRNPFAEVALPHATRLLIQYCGRLIRNEADHGRIVLLDRRIVTRRYGADLLRALPPFQRRIEHARPRNPQA